MCLRCLLHHILSLIVYTFRENRKFAFISIVQFVMSANSRIHFGLQMVFVCLYITPSHYHHCANFIWRHWTYEMPVRYNLSSVWVRLSVFSRQSIIQCVGLCVFSLPISFMMIQRIYMLCLISIITSEVWTITHFRVRSWNNGMHCMSFYILMASVSQNESSLCNDIMDPIKCMYTVLWHCVLVWFLFLNGFTLP